jgi:endogenous inhibitor of DNA gyrase (YacG/DUF329 family)
MKEFRKNQKGHLICEECGKSYKNQSALGNHIKIHMSKFEYYEKYLFENQDGYCKKCGKKVNIKGTSIRVFCSHKCALSYNNKYLNSEKSHKKARKTMLEKYGVEHSMQFNKTKEKRIKSNIKKYGVSHTLQIKEIKERIKQTNLEKYGVENISQSDIIKKKKEETSLANFGVKYHNQNYDKFISNQKKNFKIKQFKDTTLTYQGSYELDFLEKFYDKIDIENGPSTHYLSGGKKKVYHSDFYIPSKNLVIEIKSSYYYNLYLEQNIAKEKSIKSKKMNYMIILDKNYTNFHLFLKQIPLNH